MYNHPDDATLFVDKFMTGNVSKQTGNVSKQLVYRKIRIMLSHPSTNKKQLSEKLLGIAQYFAGDNDRILQSINKLFLTFLNTWLSGTNFIETFQGTSDEIIEIIQSLTDAHLKQNFTIFSNFDRDAIASNIRREMHKNGDQRLHGLEIAPHSRRQHQTHVPPFFAWSEKYVYFMTGRCSNEPEDIGWVNELGDTVCEIDHICWYELNSLPIRPITGTCPRIIFKVGSESIDDIETFQGTSDELIEKVQSLMDAYPQPSSEFFGEFRHNIRREMHKNGNRRLHGLEIARYNRTEHKINTGATPFFAWGYTHIYFMTYIHYNVYSDNIYNYSLASIPRHPRTGTFPTILKSYTMP